MRDKLLHLHSTTLRGIGSYSHGAELVFRPIGRATKTSCGTWVVIS